MSYSNAYIKDNLGLYFKYMGGYNPLKYISNTMRFYRNGKSFNNDYGYSATDIEVLNLSISPNDTITIAYQVSLNQHAPFEILDGIASTITNTATLYDNKGGTQLENSSDIITAEPFTDLSLTKWLTPNPIVQNQQVTYSFIFQNTGNTPVTSGAVISDKFSHPMTIDKVTFNNMEWTAGTEFTYSNLSRTFSSLGNNIKVQAATYEHADLKGYITTPGTSTLMIYGTVK